MRGLSIAAGPRQPVAAVVLLAHALVGLGLVGLAPTWSPGPADGAEQQVSMLVHVNLPRLVEPTPPVPAPARAPAPPTQPETTAQRAAHVAHLAAPVAEATPRAVPVPVAAEAANPSLPGADAGAAAPTAAPSATPAPAAPLATPPPPQPQTAALQQARPDHDNCPPAPYPALLRERGIEGVVRVQVRVNPEGRAAEARVVGASGWRLFDEAAVQRALACRFVPARRGSEAVEGWVDFPVRFALIG